MVKGEEEKEGGRNRGVGVDVGRGRVHESALPYVMHFFSLPSNGTLEDFHKD